MDRLNEIADKDLRANLSEIVDRASDGDVFVVTRKGKRRAAMVSMSVLKLLRKLEDESDVRAIRDRAGETTMPLDDLMKKWGVKPPRARRVRRTNQL